MGFTLSVFTATLIVSLVRSKDHPVELQHPNFRQEPPHQCSVRMVSTTMTANCSRLGFNSVPQNLARSVKVMDMARNFLRHVKQTEFAGYTNLEILKIESNLIEDIEEKSFQTLGELQVLNLRNNRLRHLNAEHFAGLVRLRTLDLGRNPLIHLNSSAFVQLTYLSHLYLDGCSLEFLDAALFSTLPHIESLDVSYNHLRTLSGVPSPYSDFLPKSLKQIVLSHNPWSCDCNIKWLAIDLHKSHSDGSIAWYFLNSGPKCKDPPLFSGLNWKDLHPSRFLCLPEISNPELASTPIYVQKYGNVSLKCSVTGDPKPSVMWTLNGREVSDVRQLKHRHVISEQSLEESQGKFLVTNSLSVYGLYEDVIGKYSCLANNIAGSKELSYFVGFTEDSSKKLVNILSSDAILPDKVTMYTAVLVLLCLASIVLFGVIIWCSYSLFRVKICRRKKESNSTEHSTEDAFFINNMDTFTNLRQSRIYKLREPNGTSTRTLI